MAEGFDKIPLRIPERWDPVWFESFVREVLALGDARNAIPGSGISITGNSDVPATISTGTDVEQLIDENYLLAETSDFLPNARTIEGESGVIDIDDDGPGQGLTIGLREGGVKNSKIRQGRECSVIGRADDSIGFVADILAAANNRLLARSGDALAFQQAVAEMIAVTATARVLARKSSGAGDAEECTLSEILDFIGSAAQGDILYRGSSGWARLPADTDGKVLTTHGAAADPTWETPAGGGGAMTFIAGNTVAGSAATSLTVSGLDLATDQEYYVRIVLGNATGSAANISLFYNADSTSTNYDRQSLAANNTTISGARANDAIIAGMAASGNTSVSVRIRRRANDTVGAISEAVRDPTTAILLQYFAHAWRTTATNVTGITLTSTVANSLSVGSYIQVFRIHD
jgi:hypothetical protein